MFRVRLTCVLLVFAGALLGTEPAVAGIGFAENQADRIRLWNDTHYEFAFRKADGRLLYIVDKTTGGQVSPGNVYGPWVLRFSNGTWLDGASFSTTNPSRLFSYAWDAQQSVLTLTYVATGTYASQVTITIQATEGPELESTLWISNNSGFEVELLAYPVQLSFQRSQIDAVYVPYLEGMKLLPSFFAGYEYTARYPGAMFADFAYTDMSLGTFAVFSDQDLAEPVIPATWHILRDDSYAGGVHKYHHDYEMALGAGHQWTSPQIVFSVGSSLAEAMDSYWTRGGFDSLPTLEQKLGATLFEKLAGAVLLKAGFAQGGWTFASLQSFVNNLPVDNLLHIVTFWPNGFDENYPDYLPPNPALGTLADFQSMVSNVRASGHLVMPYTNPTWWDDQSPTLASLGTGIVAKDRSGGLIWETYNGHGGYVVSPASPDVIARQDQTRTEFTQTAPCDLMFEDQVGARSAPTYDGNPAAPDPILYAQGLIEVAERSSQALPVMTEGGCDRLTQFESGFCNSHTIGWHWWPSTTYASYPMAPLWAHENLFFSSHNLAGEVMANDLPLMTYYVSIGYSLTHNVAALDASWLEVLDTYQKHLIARLVGVGMSSYEYLGTDGQTRTTYDDGTVITANLTSNNMQVGTHSVAPNGFLVEKDGNVLGGVATVLHGQPLAGFLPHYLVFEYGAYAIKVFQPEGDAGLVPMTRPAAWTDSNRIRAYGVKADGTEISHAVNVFSTLLQINYVNDIGGESIDHFVIVYCREGDVDCDGAIDGTDQATMAGCLTGPGVASRDPQSCAAAFDWDADSDIDLHDIAQFQAVVE